ncbi:asparagine synthase (glutamine-hydrolyzing) [Hugenholtzia roseola]|uniref:asparagine synthase (glutamine-hydrolyzing) n=1 Tax=Hugenholtzia roseola TaxID=1002 RepID=UPI0004027504|nr:asparagine synthase (glutamine-hydrolyzing) [Hugenholtzia roseola]
MCGITGVFAFNEIGRFSLVRLAAATEALAHRGPDIGKLFNDYFVGLGHRRLSIVDLSSSGTQPMTDVSGRYTIVFNGEIYNYQTLKKELQGIDFQSDTDTEVLLYLYIKEGEKCLEKLNGFFAFAVYDNEEQEIFIARDRMGIKPLYYYQDEDKFLFSSEINSLLAYKIPKKINWAAIATYFQLSYIPASLSIFENVKKLEQGQFLKVRKRNLVQKTYYTPPKNYRKQEYNTISYENAQQKLVEILEDAVRLRLIADVPVGAFLSGGIDSSVVVALASRHTSQLNTFSIGYKNEPLFDETHYAKLVAEKFKTQHQVFELSNDDIFEAVIKVLPFFGEPFADSSAVPFFILSQKTKQKATVALSGDGGDELFAGYQKYAGAYKIRKGGFLVNLLANNTNLLAKFPQSRNSFWGNKFRQANRLALAAQLEEKARYWQLSSVLYEKDLAQLFLPDCIEKIEASEYNTLKNSLLDPIRTEEEVRAIGANDINDVLYADVQMVLSGDMLMKADFMSMAQALEVRVPFLDYRLVDFAFSLPESYKIDSKIKKKIVQDAFRSLLPKELYNRPKKGFDVPLAKGFKTVLRPLLEELFDPNFIEEQAIFQNSFIQNLKKRVLEGTNFDQAQVWTLLVFQYWWKRLDIQKEIPEEED